MLFFDETIHQEGEMLLACESSALIEREKGVTFLQSVKKEEPRNKHNKNLKI